MAIEIRAIAKDEVARFREALMMTFGSDPDNETTDEQFLAVLDPAQAWAAFDAGVIVATAATFNFEVSLPGGNAMPMAGLTMVTVRPSHRRRGILRELMRHHLDDARARNYPVSGLWASDARIYGRFGYGLAAYCDVYEIANAHQLVVAAGRELDGIEWLEEPRARETLPALYARATAARPLAVRRSDEWWRERRFLETGWSRGGASRRRYVVARRGGELVGYLAFRQRGKFTDGMPDGRVEINELIASDGQAEATLWRFACSIDLFPTVAYWNAPADDALPWLADDMRRIKRRRADNVWLRIEDIPRTLSARGYTDDGHLRIAIADATYELDVTDGRGTCARTTKPADLVCSAPTLATLYTGCARASELARAELVRGDARALALADRLFATPLAPWCPEMF